jgi:dienelactone hydrolase
MRIAVTIGGTAYKLDAMLVYLDDGARHPLAIINHGSPRAAADRPTMRPGTYADQMLWFVRRGWTVAAVLRRGYGQSDGGWAETYGTCANPDYAGAGLRGAADIAATIRALKENPHVDGSRVLAIGHSAGAFATVALTSDPPTGLLAALAFAPGRGSYASDKVCGEDALVAAFAQYGRTSRVPLLWISNANDHFFDPPLVKRALDAFNGAGGRAAFFAAPPFGDEGHYFFPASDAIALWEAPVDAFLATNGLALLAQPVDLEMPAIVVDPKLGPRGRAAFERYLLYPPHKAFARTTSGHFAYAFDSPSAGDAEARARTSCAKTAHEECVIVNVDGVLAR